jgi:hypothetical protein
MLATQLARRQSGGVLFSTLMICSSVNLLLRMSVPLRNGLYPKMRAFKASRSASSKFFGSKTRPR